MIKATTRRSFHLTVAIYHISPDFTNMRYVAHKILLAKVRSMHFIYMPRNAGATPGKVIKQLINFIMNELKKLNGLQKLSRFEMRNVKGGVNAPSGCDNDCSSDSDCTANKNFPKCHFSTCQATGKPANICGVA